MPRILTEVLRLLAEVLADAVPYPHGSVPSSGRLTEVRAAVAATFDQVKEKPKRTRGYIEALLEKLPELSESESKAAVSRDPVIAFIRSARGVPLEAIFVEWLGQPGNEPEVEKYVATFDLGNLNIEETMRTVLATFRLPGEAQQISRSGGRDRQDALSGKRWGRQRGVQVCRRGVHVPVLSDHA